MTSLNFHGVALRCTRRNHLHRLFLLRVFKIDPTGISINIKLVSLA